MAAQYWAVVVRKAVPNSSRKFSRSSRLVSKQDFQSVFAKSLKISHRPFVLLYSSNALACARLGIIIGKSVYKRAVDRNRIRRIVRESFRQSSIPSYAIDIVIIVKTKIDLEKSTLRECSDQLFTKLLAAEKDKPDAK